MLVESLVSVEAVWPVPVAAWSPASWSLFWQPATASAPAMRMGNIYFMLFNFPLQK
jgi:hypothetical protein